MDTESFDEYDMDSHVYCSASLNDSWWFPLVFGIGTRMRVANKH